MLSKIGSKIPNYPELAMAPIVLPFQINICYVRMKIKWLTVNEYHEYHFYFNKFVEEMRINLPNYADWIEKTCALTFRRWNVTLAALDEF